MSSPPSYRSNLLANFFFQAEDAIRDGHVTGVQTCALPIFAFGARLDFGFLLRRSQSHEPNQVQSQKKQQRSEERRVGKECRAGRGTGSRKKKGITREGRQEIAEGRHGK